MVFGDPDHRNFNKYSNGRVSTFGDVVVGSRQDNVSLQFQYNISPDDVSTSNTNSGSVFQQNSMAQVSTGTDSSATAQLESHRGLRYLPGHEGYCYFTASFTTQDEKTGYPSSSQFVGAFNDNNGYFIGFQGEEFSIIKRRDGVDEVIGRTNFNNDTLDGNSGSKMDVDFDKLNVFRISFGWLGASLINFDIQRSDGKWLTFHTINYSGTEAIPSILNPVIPIRMQAQKSSGSTDIKIKTGSMCAGVVSQVQKRDNRHKSFTNTKSIASGDGLVSVFTLRNKETYFTKQNKINMIPIFLSAKAANKTSIRLVKNATLGGTPNFQDVDLESSVIEYDVDGTTVSGGELMLEPALDLNDQLNINLEDLYMEIFPAEQITFAANTGSTGDVTMSCRWAENF